MINTNIIINCLYFKWKKFLLYNISLIYLKTLIEVPVMFPSLATSDPYPPPKLKDFTIEKRLGTGTYATVYKATNKV